jgi:hypothetical protein
MFPLPPTPLLRQALLAGALGLLAGCNTTTYVVQVDAISDTGAATQPAKPPQSYRIRSHNPTMPEDNLRYREVSDYVKTALSGRGMYEAPAAAAADVIIEIDYGMESPRMKYETVTTPIIVLQEGPAQREIVPVSTGADGTVKYKVIRVPGLQIRKIVGWREEIEPIIVYEKYLKVSARENAEAVEGRPPPEVWSVNVSAVDKSNELRKYMPILASATADYIGTNTKEEKEVAVSENDASVKFIKKGM